MKKCFKMEGKLSGHCSIREGTKQKAATVITEIVYLSEKVNIGQAFCFGFYCCIMNLKTYTNRSHSSWFLALWRSECVWVDLLFSGAWTERQSPGSHSELETLRMVDLHV